MRERGADRGGGGAHGGKGLAHRVHAADRGERALGGAGGPERVGGLERGGGRTRLLFADQLSQRRQ